VFPSIHALPEWKMMQLCAIGLAKQGIPELGQFVGKIALQDILTPALFVSPTLNGATTPLALLMISVELYIQARRDV